MTVDLKNAKADYKATVFLPRTDFPMRANLPEREPQILERWKRMSLFRRLRETSAGREKFVLHDGPPYANGAIHMGTALNKILKDVVNRAQQMLGKDANYVPGWDCHGLPIEWKIEEKYRAAGKDKDLVPVIQFRRECRDFASHWIDVQRADFRRLGVEGDWDNPYTTMSYPAEAQIVREVMAFATNGLLYRGSKPVMWSVVEKTALAEAEIEYEDYVSDQVWVKFGIGRAGAALQDACIVIWTTTPWTLPGNRAIAYSPRIKYGLYEVTEAPDGNWTRAGEKLVIADALAADVLKQARVTGSRRLGDVEPSSIQTATHPLRGRVPGYEFDVPMLAGDHVTEDAGTGFVHTAPGHGREDFEIWTASRALIESLGVNSAIPFTVDDEGFFTEQAHGFTGRRVITDKGEKGDANEAVIKALIEAGALLGRARLQHQYPHSWRSKKPVIFRNTPQWFIAMDKDIAGAGDTLRARALAAIKATRWVPPQGENRINGMIESRPDWVISRQRAWGVPIAVFIRDRADGSTEILKDPRVNARVTEAFQAEGADAWFAEGAAERFLRPDHDPAGWRQVMDILDVWFESGSTHGFVLEPRADLRWPAHLYLEGSDQHRGWFHSSLLESCGTRGRAPYDAVLTHGFVLDEQGRKMSKSLGNTVEPQAVMKQHGADILRLWVVASDYAEDLKIGPEILKHHAEAYRRFRNTLRYLLGALADFDAAERMPAEAMPELDRWVLHRLCELDAQVRRTADDFDFHTLFTQLHNFCAVDLSAFYFDVRKDALYCDRPDAPTRRAARTVMEQVFSCLTAWLAPILCYTAEEAWLHRPEGLREGVDPDGDSVHLRTIPALPADWRDEALAARWQRIRDVRRVVTGALELERASKRIGASLQAHPVLHVGPQHRDALAGVDLAEIAITSALTLAEGTPPADAFTLPDVAGVGVVVRPAEGEKCERCWKVLPEVGTHAEHASLCNRCADAVAER